LRQGHHADHARDMRLRLSAGPEGAEVLCHCRVLTPPEHLATPEVGMRVEFEPESGPTGLPTVTITVTPLKTPPLRAFQALADYFHRHAAR
jgi:hypothetical protein